MRRFARAAIAASLWLGGCAILSIDPPPDNVQGPNSLWVVAPVNPETETFTVRFGRDFVPGTFAAQLDGGDITNLWVPPNPGPNGSVRLFYQDIFRGGNCFAGVPPWMTWGWYPPISPTFCTHTLHAHGDVANAGGAPITVTDKSVDFVPVQLGLIPKIAGRYLGPDDTQPLVPGQSMTVTLTAATYGPWPPDQTAVVAALDGLVGDNPAGYISLNGLPPGQQIFLSGIPGDFTVTNTGNPVRARFRLRARAFGSQETEYGNLFACQPGFC